MAVLSVADFEVGCKSSFQALRELELGKGAVNFSLVNADATAFETDAYPATIGSQRSESEAPALNFRKPFAQFTFVADNHSRLFQGVQEFIKGLVTKTAHLRLRQEIRRLPTYEANNVVRPKRLTKHQAEAKDSMKPARCLGNSCRSKTIPLLYLF
jgi:hypothetical protein